ncbi:CAP domain-containing protein [Defluviimonas sp. WL0024]|uniref:CAP domain-containing protein n=2 Tax=Albidovulum TaxID=205889 RepID=A0ABT3J196_9RHOB|nr:MULTISPECIES: CAP domain-containing protein [Defluviimonas]MCU9848130.1 CAP domain-containing protein [Defluviimonas sp. WL0024]MCW3781440.1 CAP domain-containing protein [Defluviimonas salinarum]
MIRLLGLFLVAALTVAGCATTPPAVGPDGRPLPKAYVIKPGDEGRVTYSMVDSVNTLRGASGAAPLNLNSQLTAAAATHSRDMAVQNRPWHFGSDGSSPLLRVQRAGYPGMMLGENISETYETELETLSAWMDVPDTRAVILDPNARDVGFSWYQEPSGKIWWTLVTGG